jgi:hypothetical protein
MLELNQEHALVGNSVAGAGDVNGDGFDDVLVGAYAFDNGEENEGIVSLFYGSQAGLADTAAWTAEGNKDHAQFGFSVASAGDVNGDEFDDVIIGARFYANDRNLEGRVFVYVGSATGLADTAAWTAEGDQQSALFGNCVASAGDVNNDGYGDVIIGAFVYDNGEADEGRAFVYLGSEVGLADTAAWTAEGDQELAAFGACVASAGDVNNDGYDDIVVGAPGYDNGESDEGRAYLYLGSESGPADSASWITEVDQDGASYGNSVATAGDINNDSFSDVIVGAYRWDGDALLDLGAAFVYLGSSSGLADTASWVVVNDVEAAEYGTSVSTAGDINNDGYSDVIVGAPGFDHNRLDGGGVFPSGLADGRSRRLVLDEGGAFIYLGSDSGLSVIPVSIGLGGAPATYYGNSVATAGDINNDRFSDVLVGASRLDNPEQDEGRALAYWNSDLVDAPFPNSGVNGGGLRILLSRPNPSSSKSTLVYSLERRGVVRITIHDSQGRSVRELLRQEQAAGIHSITWDRGNHRNRRVSPGIYFGRLELGHEVRSTKIVITD